jgi:hypothetical protein
MIGIFSVFEVMEPQKNFMDESYKPSEYKLTWILIVTFPNGTSLAVWAI